jgi:BASS family bile acid:Na+ symporter
VPTVFMKIVVAVLLVSMALSIGMSLERGDLRRAARDRGTLLRALFASLVFVPIITLLVARQFRLGTTVASALVLLSVCPIAPFAPHATRRIRGDVPLAMLLTLLLGVLTPITAAPTGRLLLEYTGPLRLRPIVMIVQLLLLQLVPLLIALSIRRRDPRWGRAFARVVDAIFALSLIALVVIAIVPRLPAVARLGWLGLLATLVTAAISMLAGALMGKDARASRTLATVGAVPNIGLALALARGANVAPEGIAILVGMFLVRVVVNLMWLTLVRRRATAPISATPR